MRRVLTAALLLDMVASVLVSPLGGLETRDPFAARPFGFLMLGVFGVGMAMVVTSLVKMSRARPGAARLSAIGALLFIPTVVSDQVGWFHPLPPPTPICMAEYAVIALSLVAAAVGLSLREVNKPVMQAS